MRVSPPVSVCAKMYTVWRPKATGPFPGLLLLGAVILPLLIGGCALLGEGYRVSALSQEANQLFNQGNYAGALEKYEEIIEGHPGAADRVLFEMGVIHAYPHNGNKDYRKSLACFQKLLEEHPDSEYRLDSQMMILQIQNVIIKDQVIATQKADLEVLRQTAESKADEVVELQDRVAELEEKVFALRTEPADKVLIEKKARRLTLLSKGEVIKTYKIALGGDPVGPKEREGDNRTPEGIYSIDARNGNSGFHLALHISYPNEQDKLRAAELGVSPGGNIMIHGIKNGYAKLGASHAENDWTEGCIAVTNQEMEEIYKFVPIGTTVEITP